MADIVERLRTPANQFLFDPPTAKIATELVNEAADEIERLRAVGKAVLGAMKGRNPEVALDLLIHSFGNKTAPTEKC